MFDKKIVMQKKTASEDAVFHLKKVKGLMHYSNPLTVRHTASGAIHGLAAAIRHHSGCLELAAMMITRDMHSTNRRHSINGTRLSVSPAS